MLKCMVLLAEDFDDTRELYRFCLESAGFAVHDLPSGSGVLPLAVELQPDVVVVDLGLPDLDGASVTAQVRAHPLTAHIPIVVLSAHAYDRDEARAMEQGAAAFLRKPCLPEVLVATLLRVSETCREKQEKAGGPQPAAGV
jgi:two-component system, cell cycle response regulator DivK